MSARFQTLVRAADLAPHLDDPDWIVVDVRHDLVDHGLGRRQYAAGHVPGAHFLSLETDLSGPKTGKNGRHPLPAVEAFAATLSALGVDAGKQVVAYDQSVSTYSARLWWMLRWVGHRNVAVLDGGLKAWTAAGQPVATDVPVRRPARFVPAVSEAPVTVQTLAAHLGELEYALVDARAADRFRGQNETIDPVGGHIPGARNRPFGTNLTGEATFKDAATLRAEWDAMLGGGRPADVVHSCGSGVTACNNLLAMELAGLTGSRLFTGSWSEWSADPARPIER